MESEFRQRHQEQQQRYEDVIRQLGAQVQQYQLQMRDGAGGGGGGGFEGAGRDGYGGGGGMRADAASMGEAWQGDELVMNQVPRVRVRVRVTRYEPGT